MPVSKNRKNHKQKVNAWKLASKIRENKAIKHYKAMMEAAKERQKYDSMVASSDNNIVENLDLGNVNPEGVESLDLGELSTKI